MIVAFFDFDGTITKKDTFLDVVSFCFGKFKMITGVLLFAKSAIGYKLGLVSGHTIKEKLLTHFFKGMPVTNFEKKTTAYTEQRLDRIIKKSALKKIEWHQQQGQRVIVVSASVEQWIQPWCNHLNIEYIATQLEVKNDVLTGKLSGNNCIGQEKVNRIRQYLDFDKVTYSYAYGNSKGDRELLGIADEAFYRNFK